MPKFSLGIHPWLPLHGLLFLLKCLVTLFLYMSTSVYSSSHSIGSDGGEY